MRGALLATTGPSGIRPDPAVVRRFRGNFGGLVMPELTTGFPNKVLFTPGYVCEPYAVRRIIRQRYRAAGLTHFPISTWGPTVYRDYYPPWDDRQINRFLEELLGDGLIPVCSLFRDGGKAINPALNPALVPAAFWWEDPTPIRAPALDGDNKFWIVRQALGDQVLIYWHNPPNQDAPYIDYAAWGLRPGDPTANLRVWQYLQNSPCRVQGLLLQTQAWVDVDGAIGITNDFLNRLPAGKLYGTDLDVVSFESAVYWNTTLQGNVAQGNAWAQQTRTACLPGLAGWCNG